MYLGPSFNYPCSLLHHYQTSTPASPPRLTVLPLARRRVDDAEQLVVGDRLGVEVVEVWSPLQVLVRAEQRLPHHGLAGAGVTDDEDRVSHVQQLLKLHHLGKEGCQWDASSQKIAVEKSVGIVIKIGISCR